MRGIRIMREEGGQVLVILLVLLAVGSLLVTSTLSMGASGFKIQQSAKEGTNALYAADVGVQQALWWLKSVTYQQLPIDPDVYVEFPNSGVFESNGVKAFAFLNYADTLDGVNRYCITSVAGPDVIHDHVLANQPAGYTRIVSFVSSVSGDLTGIMNQVITSQNGYTVQGGQSSVSPPEGDPHGPAANYAGMWPTGDQLYQFYWQRVDSLTSYESAALEASTTPSLGPFYRNGALDIENSGAAGATITLQGTMFVNGDLQIGTTGQNFNLDLNGQTIYVNSNTVGLPYALQMGGKVNIVGSGAIIALGDIQFKPGISSGPSNYLFVMSVIGMSYMQPGGNYYGTVAGSTTVYDQNGSITWTDPSSQDLDVPGLGSGAFWAVRTWDISIH